MSTFADTIRLLSGGRLDELLLESMREVVAAVHETGKPGKLTLTLTVKPNEERRSVMISPDVKTSAPKPNAGESLFFSTEDGEMMRTDPKQPDLPFRAVETREVSNFRSTDR